MSSNRSVGSMGDKTLTALSADGRGRETLNQDPKPKRSKRMLIVAVAIVISVALSGTYFAVSYLSQPPCPSGASLRSFVIIANDTNGYNSSRYQTFRVNVQKGDCVFITFVNNSPVQPHGLAINYYLNGIIVQPNKTESAKFQANKTGQFQVFEHIASSINGFTDNCGTLTVV